jgi:hypothetical protein
MPFTPAHTAVVLPFLRVDFLSATGLIIGSMSPDFEYFMKLSVDGVHGHTWPGLFYFDLPVSFVLALVFHKVVRPNLFLSLPYFLKARFSGVVSVNFLEYFRKNPVVFIGSVLAGGATHIIWDGFTHGNGFFVDYFSFYDGAYVPFMGVNYPLWYALQHISTMAGLTFLAGYILLMKERPVANGISWIYWLLVLSITAMTTIIRFTVNDDDFNLGNLVVTAIGGTCAALVICGFMPSRYFAHGLAEKH